MNRKTPKFIRLLSTFALTAAAVLIALYSVYMVWEQPPEKADTPLAARAPQLPAPSEAPGENAAPTPVPSPAPSEEPGGVYTILLVGNDDGNGNTDTILLGKLDTAAHSLHVVSIPRDTLINADWEVRKVNAVYWGDRLQGGSGIDALRRHIRMLTGFEPDNYAVLDLGDLVTAVDLLGGLDFEVPFAMHYDDPGQNLHIHLEPGQQHLSGEQVMGLLRYRSGYPTGDLGRIEMQQSFLRACLEQYAALGKVPNLMQAAEYPATATPWCGCGTGSRCSIRASAPASARSRRRIWIWSIGARRATPPQGSCAAPGITAGRPRPRRRRRHGPRLCPHRRKRRSHRPGRRSSP